MKKALKIFLIILILLIALVVAAGVVAYLNATRIAEWAAARALPDAKVKIGAVHLSLTGAEVRDLTVADKRNEPVIRAGRVQTRFSIGALCRGEVGHLALEKLVVHVAQNEAKQWNVTGILPAPTQPAAPSKPLRVGRLSIKDGELFVGQNEFTDSFGPVRFEVEVADFDSSNPLAVNFQAAVHASGLTVSVRALANAIIGVGDVRLTNREAEIRDVSLKQSDGVPLIGFESARADFSIDALLRGAVDGVSVRGLTVSVAQDDEKNWNLLKVLPAANEPASDASGAAAPDFRIGSISVDDGKLVIGSNEFTGPFGPVGFDVNVADFDVAQPLAAKIRATVRADSLDIPGPKGDWHISKGTFSAAIAWETGEPTKCEVRGVEVGWRGQKMVELPLASVELEPLSRTLLEGDEFRIPDVRRATLSKARVYVPSNQWARASGPIALDVNARDVRGGDWQTAKLDGQLVLPRCDVTEPERDIAVRGLEGAISFHTKGEKPTATVPAVSMDLVRVGGLSARNLSANVKVETDGKKIAADLSGPQITGRVVTEGRSEVQVRNVAVEMHGQVLSDWSLVTAAFDVPTVMASNRIEQVQVDGGRLIVWEDSDGEWNINRLIAEEEEESSEAEGEKEPAQSVLIDALAIRGGKLVMGTNTVFAGLAPVSVDIALRDVDTGDLEAISGEGTIRLPACEVRLLDYPVTVSGLTAEAALKFGKTAGSLFAAEGSARAARALYKNTRVDAITATIKATEKTMRAPKINADFYGSPVTGFGAVQLNADPIWYNIGLEIAQVDMQRLTAAIVPDLFSAEGKSYLYLEAVGNLEQPVTWASLKFKTKGNGTVTVKDLRKLLAASNMAPDQQQLFLLAFDRGEVLPYKSAWMNADLHARKLTVATAFERQAKWFMGLEVKPPAFEIPLDLLKEKGWLP